MAAPEDRDQHGALGAIEGMLQLARSHRQHERYHSLSGLENAAALKRDANALKVLADHWLRSVDNARSAIDYQDPAFRAAGCEDLSDPTAVATTGILFMEGEGEPRELKQMKGKLWAISDSLGKVSRWLVEKMDAGWQREKQVLTPELAAAARPRFMALTRTTLAGAKFGVAARLMDAALHALNTLDFRPEALRKDLRGAAGMVRTASYLLDEAAALLAEQAAQLGLSDPDWTEYIEELEAMSARGSGASALDPAGGEAPT
jgi:hypothetical protein